MQSSIKFYFTPHIIILSQHLICTLLTDKGTPAYQSANEDMIKLCELYSLVIIQIE